MANKAQDATRMGIGKKGGGKHYTAAEVAARQKAAASLTRESVRMYKPKWLSAEARKVWDQRRKQAADLGMLDDLDADIFAVYCETVVQYGELLKTPSLQRDAKFFATIRSLAITIEKYATKLGFTPEARARLAKKRADEELNAPDPLADFD
jgi:phage terminase small subunit